MDQATARILDPDPPEFIPESDLVSSDGVPVETPWHSRQIHLFLDVTDQAMDEQGEAGYYAGGDMFVYYSDKQAEAIRKQVEQLWLFELGGDGEPIAVEVSKKNYRGPDVFVVRGGVVERDRKIWASWLEGGRLPSFILELQSKSTADGDARDKRELYSRVFRTPEYFYYGPDDPDLGRHRDVLVGLSLSADGTYEEIEPDERGWVRSEVLGCFVGRWDGVYRKQKARWMRLYDRHGRLIPTAEERERLRAEAAEAEVARLRKLLGRP